MYRIARLAVAAAALTALAGCGGRDAAAPQNTTSAATTSSAVSTSSGGDETVQGATIKAALDKAHGKAAWLTAVKSVTLDGAAVVVVADLPKRDPAAVPMCEAVYAAAEAAKVEFQSVAVRSTTNSTLSSRNKLSKDTACKA
ncbi:hypothetical protein [Crossiella sp. CA198]|uniref:hypothetical protein n=1 Tax=Crossiella sp. CA198 TaxID=3455607 RepID=UPI003F8D5233